MGSSFNYDPDLKMLGIARDAARTIREMTVDRMAGTDAQIASVIFNTAAALYLHSGYGYDRICDIYHRLANQLDQEHINGKD